MLKPFFECHNKEKFHNFIMQSLVLLVVKLARDRLVYSVRLLAKLWKMNKCVKIILLMKYDELHFNFTHFAIPNQRTSTNLPVLDPSLSKIHLGTFLMASKLVERDHSKSPRLLIPTTLNHFLALFQSYNSYVHEIVLQVTSGDYCSNRHSPACVHLQQPKKHHK